jgi:hypothetical protein
MKLKYYLRGMGIGIILTAIVMGFALGGRKATLSDAEIIQRAKALGMVEADQGTLSDTHKEPAEEQSDDASTSDQTLDQAGKEISEEEHQDEPEADTTVSDVAQKEEEGAAADSEASEDPVGPEKEVSLVTTEPTAAELSTAVAIADASGEESSSLDNAEETTDEEVKPAPAAPAVSGKTVTIPGGKSSDQVAELLFNEGIVDNAVSFNRYLIDRGIDRIIRSGTKVIPEGADYEKVANIITGN